jgi:capsular polysaccharide biosynthesis protein/MinD-like ATPase involved in chromosome partitioning or flagellar assembly
MSQMAAPDEFQVADYAGVFRRRWWVILAVVLICVAASLGYLKEAQKVYTATASVYVTATSATANQLADGRTSGTVNLDTEAQIVQSTAVAQAAAKLMHNSQPIPQLVTQVSVTVPANSQVLSISCQQSSADAAASCAESFAKAYLSYSTASTTTKLNSQISALQSRVSALQSDSAKLTSEMAILPPNSTQRANAQEQLNSDNNQLSSLNSQIAGLTADMADPSGGSILSDAVPPSKASNPKASLVIPSGLVAGLLIGLILAFIIDRRDHRVRRPQDLARLNLPVLMSLPPRRPALEQAILPVRSPDGRDFAELAHALISSLGGGSHVILVTGVSAGRGTGFTAANLAVALSRNQPDVTLVCADVESVIPDMVGLSASPGLTQVLAGALTAGEASHYPVAAPRLRVIPPGSVVQADGLRQDAVERLFASMRREDKYIVVEAPPVASSPDVYALAHSADSAVLVAEIRRTRSEQILDSVQYFAKVGGPMTGVVLVPALRAPGSGTRHRSAITEAGPEPPIEAARAAAVPATSNGAAAVSNGRPTSKTEPFDRIVADASGMVGGARDVADSDPTTALDVPSSLPES